VEPAPVAAAGDVAAAALSGATPGAAAVLPKPDRIVHDTARSEVLTSSASGVRRLAMTDQPVPSVPSIPKVEELFQHIPHPRIAQRVHEKPVKVNDERVGLNGKVALIITTIVGTMWCAYIFAILGLTGIAGAVTNRVTLVLLVGAVSGYFLQLVLLPIIIVGQNIQGKASDKRSEQTYKDAEAILSECLQLQTHLKAQDTVLDDVIDHVKRHHEELQKLSARIGPATA
jgi:hypothetical protein